MVLVDLVATGRHKSFSFMADIRGIRFDFQARKIFVRELYADDEIINFTNESSFVRDTNARLDNHFDSLNFQNPIASSTTQSGMILINPHRKTRLLSIEFLGQGQIFSFTLFPRVPDDISDDSELMARVNRLIEAADVDY